MTLKDQQEYLEGKEVEYHIINKLLSIETGFKKKDTHSILFMKNRTRRAEVLILQGNLRVEFKLNRLLEAREKYKYFKNALSLEMEW